MRSLGIFGAAAALACLHAGPADATTIIDQDALVLPGGIGTAIVTPGARSFGGQPVNLRYVQTVSAGRRGILEALEFQGYRSVNQATDTLRLSLISGDYAAGARDVIGTQLIDARQVPLFAAASSASELIRFDTQAFNYGVDANQIFSILFEVLPTNQFGTLSFVTARTYGTEQQPNGMFMQVTKSADYSRGGLYQLSASGAPIALSHDIGFRSLVAMSSQTGVGSLVAAVPEPKTWAMLLLGFALVGSSIRRGRRPAAPASA